MTYVLDTNAVSALMAGDATVLGRLKSKDKHDVLIPQPVLAAIAYGLERLPRSKRRDTLTTQFELIRSELGRAPWNDAVSDHFGAIKAALEKRGRRIEDFDAAIAAHAVALTGALVTANAAHMARIPGLRIEDWST